MMLKVLGSFAASCLLLSSTLGSASNGDTLQGKSLETGSDLGQVCGAEQETAWLLICLSYIRGVVHSHIATVERNRNLSKSIAPEFPEIGGAFCPPEDFDYEQARMVVMKFLAENPEGGRYPAAGVILYSLSLEYPCSPPSTK